MLGLALADSSESYKSDTFYQRDVKEARTCYDDYRATGNGWRKCCGVGGGAVCGAYGDGCRSVRALQERAIEAPEARTCYDDCRATGNGWRKCCGVGGGAVCGAYGDGCRSVRALQERAVEEEVP